MRWCPPPGAETRASRPGRRSLAERGSGSRCQRRSGRLSAADTRSAWSRLQTYEVMSVGCIGPRRTRRGLSVTRDRCELPIAGSAAGARAARSGCAPGTIATGRATPAVPSATETPAERRRRRRRPRRRRPPGGPPPTAPAGARRGGDRTERELQPAARGAPTRGRRRDPRCRARTRGRPAPAEWVSRSADWSSESSPSTRRDAQPRARSHCWEAWSSPSGTQSSEAVSSCRRSHECLTRIGDRPEHDHEEPDRDQKRRERDRLALLVGRGPAHPPLHRERRSIPRPAAATAHGCRRRSRWRGARSRRRTSRRESERETPAPNRKPISERDDRRRRARACRASLQCGGEPRSLRPIRRCRPSGSHAGRAAHLLLGQRPALERVVALREWTRRHRG